MENGKWKMEKNRFNLALLGFLFVFLFAFFSFLHAEIHGMRLVRAEVHRPAVAQMHLQTTARRTKAAHHRRGRVRREPRRNLAETELPGRAHEIRGERTRPSAKQRIFHARFTQGIRSGATDVKNR